MDDQASTTAYTLELLHLNQVAIRAALEELSLWVSHRGRTSEPSKLAHMHFAREELLLTPPQPPLTANFTTQI